jgi:glutathione S-transferase
LFKLGDTDQAIVDQQKAVLNTTLNYYEKTLEAQEYLTGKVRDLQSTRNTRQLLTH